MSFHVLHSVKYLCYYSVFGNTSLVVVVKVKMHT